MNRRMLSASLVVLLISFISLAPACAEDTSVYSAVGAWSGGVAWNERTFYSWEINPDGTFSSGRVGRGHDGGGFWSAEGASLSLKYDDGFRYEGELSGDAYSGTAYLADGRSFGTFWMSRVQKRVSDVAADDY